MVATLLRTTVVIFILLSKADFLIVAVDSGAVNERAVALCGYLISSDLSLL